MLPGDKPEPGGEIAPSFEDIHRRREGLDRQGRDWADARHRLQTPGRFAACRFLSRHLLKSGDGFRQPFDLIQKDTRQFHDEKRKRCRLILDRIFENFHIRRPLRGHDAVLRQMTAEGIYQLRALPDQKIPRPEQHGARLLFLGLNRDKAHRRSTCRLSDRFRVGGIVLLALDERFDIGGRDQSNLMPEVPDGSPPVVRTPAGFQGDDAARLLGKEAENFFSRELFAEPNAAVGKGAMRLERPLCKIETDNANLLHGCSLRSWDAKTSPPWHIAMPSGGASTPSLIAFLGLVHLRVAALLLVLGRGRSGDDRGVDNRPPGLRRGRLCRISKPRSSSIALTSSNRPLVRSCRSSQCRKCSTVVASGIASRFSAIPAKPRSAWLS